jgi:hypothetical protein
MGLVEIENILVSVKVECKALYSRVPFACRELEKSVDG